MARPKNEPMTTLAALPPPGAAGADEAWQEFMTDQLDRAIRIVPNCPSLADLRL